MSRVPLTARYRPATFADVCGQRAVKALLYLMCKRGTLPPGLLLHGEHGSGKTSMARIVARALNCEAPPGKASQWPCGACPACKAVTDGTSPDVEELDAASNGTVDRIRDIRERAYFGTFGGRHKVYIIDEAHGLSGAAADALLKVLEEPPDGVVFILITTQFKSVSATVRSRLSPFPFRRLPAGVVRERLAAICAAEEFTVEPELLTAIASSCGGALRDAVVRLDQVTSVGVGSLAMWRELTGEVDYAPGLLSAAADGDYPAMYAAMDDAVAATGSAGQVAADLVSCLIDLLVLSCGGSVAAQGDGLARRQDLLARVGVSRAQSAMAVLWELHVKIHAEDRQTGLQLALEAVRRKLCPPPKPVPIAAGNPATAAEMKDILGAL